MKRTQYRKQDSGYLITSIIFCLITCQATAQRTERSLNVDSAYDVTMDPKKNYNDTDNYENGKMKSIFRYRMVLGHKMCHFTLYNEDGTVYSEGHYKDGQMNDSLVNYTPNGEIAFIQVWTMGTMFSEKLYYQLYPDQTYHFISKVGYYDFQDGTSVITGTNTPDGYIEEGLDLISKTRKYYIWEHGEKREYVITYPDGTIEDIYNGNVPGIYKWENHKKELVRPYSQKEIDVHKDSALTPTYIQLR